MAPARRERRYLAACTSSVLIDNTRDISQDRAFGMQQLADIALRAISPAVNDPSTTVTIVDYLRSALEQLAACDMPARKRYFPDRNLIMVVHLCGFDEYAADPLATIGIMAPVTRE